MIAIALANRPDVLIADEPTTALDVTVQAQILTLLRELQASHGMSMVLITHDLTIVQKFSDYVYVMQHGRVVEHGRPASSSPARATPIPSACSPPSPRASRVRSRAPPASRCSRARASRWSTR